MATVRSDGYVVTASVWNAVLSRLTDDGATFSGAVNGSTGAFSSTLAVTGTTTLGVTNVGGLLSANAGIDVGAASYAAGRVYFSSSFGTTIGAKTGSVTDFAIYNPAGSQAILTVPTGTVNVSLGGTLTVPQLARVVAAPVLASPVSNQVIDNSAQASVVELTALSAGSPIGLTPGSDGQFVVLINQSGNTQTLVHESGSATAAARFLLVGGANFGLVHGHATMFVYSGTFDRWVQVSGF